MEQITEVTNNINLENELTNSNNNLEKGQLKDIKKTRFQLECERGISIKEARQHTHEFIKQLWKK